MWGWFEVGTGAALAAERGAGDIEEGEARAAGSQVCVCHTWVSSDQPHNSSKSCSLTLPGQWFGSK